MRRRPFTLVLSTMAATLSLVLLAYAQEPLPEAKEVMQGEIKYLQSELDKTKILKKAKGKIRMSAVVLAAAAKASGKGSEGIVPEALKISKLMDEDKAADAKKIIGDIASGKGAPGKAASYKDVIDFDLVMRIFSSEKIGGFGLERELEDLVGKTGPVKGDDAKKVVIVAGKIALIGDISHHFAPEKDEGMKTKKAWNQFSDDMSKAARELASTASKNGEIGKLADRLSKTCVACHDVFR